ncbi:MAG: hypothetical protein FWF50_03510 [Defluviitaleaceae bacterium]|nr:hypothetical protein [Defluviitaleaceae bacterium]
MRDDNLKIEPFEILKLHSVTAKQAESEHGVLKLVGTIPEHKESEYLAMGFSSASVKIYITQKDGSEQIWFDGVITELEIETDNEQKVLFVTAKTGTCLMDISLHTRTYQESSITYDEVLASYTNDYPSGSFIMKKGSGTPIKKLIMQYRETDWEYTKRLATHFNTPIIPDFKTGGTKYYFGITDSGSVKTIETRTYKVRKDIKEFQYKSKRGMDISEMDCIYYLLRYRDVYCLGDNIILNKKPLYVSKIDTKLEGHELYHTYHLKTLSGFRVPRECNTGTIGASFYSKILDVRKDEVKISVNLDENKASCGTRWFPYSTPYSTPDGTGWYAMPEIGDDVRLYIPDEEEGGAYVISSTHLESSAGDERVNPDFKSIMNKYGKEVLFTPNSLTFTNNKGMSIQLLDEEGIKIISDKTIQIQSEESINIVSTQDVVTVLSPEKILLQQDEVITELKENISFEAAQVHID